MTIVSAIYQYPVKGLNGISLDKTSLVAGLGIPNDRRFAITRDLPSDYDGSWLPPSNFAVNSQVDNLQKYLLEALDDGSFEITSPNRKSLTFHPEQFEQAETELAQSFFAALDPPIQSIACRLVRHNGTGDGTKGMWDYPEAEISIINNETIKAIGSTTNQEIDPLRFRGNLLIDEFPAWHEYGWIGKILEIGGAKLEVLRPIDRCPATSVDPQIGQRDFDMPSHLQDTTGHVFCGVYARVLADSEILTGSSISVFTDSPKSLEQTFSERAPAYPLWPRLAVIDHRSDLGKSTQLTIAQQGPWQFAAAKENQRARVHIPHKGWTGAPIKRSDAGGWTLEILPSTTNDPLTEYLRCDVQVGDNLVVSGPYGGRR